MKKIIINKAKGTKAPRQQGIKVIEKTLKKIMDDEKVDGTVSVTFCDDKFIRKLNRDYRKKDCATDVLSFKMGEDGLLGDIIISVDTAIRQSKEFGCSLNDELLRLAEHGLLHLLGYTHKEMEKRIKN